MTAPDRLTILHVIPSIALADGGPSVAVRLMTKTLADRGHRVLLAATDAAGASGRLSSEERQAEKRQFAENGVALTLKPRRTGFYKFSPELAAWLWRAMATVDVAHVHGLFSFSSVAAGWAARHRGAPYIVRPLGAITHYGMTARRPGLKKLSLALFERPHLAGAAAVHFTSAAEAAEAAQLELDLRAEIAPIGVSASEETPPSMAAARAALGAPADRPLVLYLSRLDPKKNVEGLLRALAALGERGSQTPALLLAGDGAPDYLAALRQTAERLGIGGDVLWLGHVSGAHKAACFAAADLFALPSHSENFGIAAAEAMAAGVPALLSKGVALASEAEAAGAARAVGTTPQEIAEGLQDLLFASPERRAAMRAHAKAHAEANFTPDAMAIALEGLYHRAIMGAGGGASPTLGQQVT